MSLMSEPIRNRNCNHFCVFPGSDVVGKVVGENYEMYEGSVCTAVLWMLITRDDEWAELQMKVKLRGVCVAVLPWD